VRLCLSAESFRKGTKFVKVGSRLRYERGECGNLARLVFRVASGDPIAKNHRSMLKVVTAMPSKWERVPVWIWAVIAAIFLEVPFVFSVMLGPHSVGSWPGLIFFSPVIRLFSLFPDLYFPNRVAVPAMLLAQTALLAPLVFWILTGWKRGVLRTILGVFSVLGVVAGGEFLLEKFQSMEQQISELTSELTHHQVVDSLRTLNAAIARYKTILGKYPSDLEQLESPLDCHDPPECKRFLDNAHFLPAQNYFMLNYAVKGSGYEITADPYSPRYSSLAHYFTNETGLIRSEEHRRANAESGVIGEQNGRVTTN
jgi:hypothetical protein